MNIKLIKEPLVLISNTKLGPDWKVVCEGVGDAVGECIGEGVGDPIGEGVSDSSRVALLGLPYIIMPFLSLLVRSWNYPMINVMVTS